MLRQRNLLFVLVLISILSVIATVLTTRWGINVNPDSASYLNAARNFMAGQGVIVSFHSLEPGPLLWFAPAYPVLLALGSVIFGDPLQAGFWLQILLLVGSIFLAALAVYECTGGSTAATIAGAALVASAPDVLFYHTFIMTEAPFIFFTLLSWLLLSRYLQTGSLIMLALTALITLGAFMFRYSGAGLVGTSGLAILLFSRQRIMRRMMDGVLFGVISTVPVLLWMRWVAMQSGTGDGRSFIFHLIPLRKLVLGAFTVLRWLLPEDMLRQAVSARSPVALLGLALIATLAVLLAISVIRHYKLANWAALRRAAQGIPPLAALLLVFAVGYLAFLIFSISFLDAYTYLEERLMLPIHVAVIIIGTYAAYETIRRLPKGSWLRQGLMAGVALLVLSYVAQGALQAAALYNDGVEFTSAAWRESALMAFVNEQPPGTLIYTDNPEAIYLITGRTSLRVPMVYDFSTLEPNTHMEAEIQAMGEALQGGGYIVMFNDKERPHVVTDAMLAERLPLAEVMHADKGAVYELGG